MTFQLVCIEPKELTQYKSDMQEAFQKGFEDAFGKTDAVILPEKDIDQSLNAEGSAVYKAVFHCLSKDSRNASRISSIADKQSSNSLIPEQDVSYSRF